MAKAGKKTAAQKDATDQSEAVTPKTDAEETSAAAEGDLDAPETGEDAPETGEAPQEEEAPAVEVIEDAEVIEPTEEEATVIDAAPVVVEEPRRASVLPMIFGGLLAGAIGFVVAEYVLTPPVDTQMDGRVTAIEANVSDLQGRETASAADLAQVQSAAEAALATARGEIDAQLNDIRDRITALEDRPVTTLGGEDVAAAYEAEIAALKSRFDTLAGDAEARLAEAEQAAAQTEAEATRAAQKAQARAAMAQVRVAIDAGTPFGGVLGEALDLAGVRAAEPLQAAAAEGVPTLETLREAYPEAARAALAASRRATGEAQGITGFLKTQLGVRSLEPQEGNDPDAILSRAEAALNDGRLADAVAELEALPDEGRAPLDAWRAEADLRLSVVAAADALTAEISGN